MFHKQIDEIRPVGFRAQEKKKRNKFNSATLHWIEYRGFYHVKNSPGKKNLSFLFPN